MIMVSTAIPSKDSFGCCLAPPDVVTSGWELSSWACLHCQPPIFLNLRGFWLLDWLLYNIAEIHGIIQQG